MTQGFILVDYMLARAAELLENLKVYPEEMLARLMSARGLPFSEGLLLALVKKGLPRREAHALVQRLSGEAEREGIELKEAAACDPQVQKLLDPGELDAIFDLKKALSRVSEIFRRLSPPK